MIFGMVFLVSIPVFVCLIHLLKVMRGVQKIYELSPAQHQGKSGTVSMGGIGIVLGILGVSVGLHLTSRPVGFCLAALVGFAAIGLLDDILSIKRDQNLGLKARHKFLIQTVIGWVAVAGFHFGIHSLEWWEFALYWLLFNGVSNATNLTDGLDGLLGGLSVITLTGFAVLFHAMGMGTMTQLMLGCISILAGFLVFNLNPARVFMGDTGSLALGAFFVAVSMVLGNPWVLLGFGGVYLIETVSVILQVGSFKLTGKRVFKMAPLHHHFELSGMTEWQVVALFWSVGVGLMGVTVWIFYWIG